MLGENINTVKRNIETLFEGSRQVGLELNTERTKYMFVSHHQNVGQSHILFIANKSFENVVKFKHLGTTETNKNCIPEEVKRRLHSRNACYHSVQSLV
jgi:hypothetical protein